MLPVINSSPTHKKLLIFFIDKIHIFSNKPYIIEHKKRKYDRYLSLDEIDEINDTEPKSLNWNNIANNPNLTWPFIKKHLNKPWNVNRVLKNKCITWPILRDAPELRPFLNNGLIIDNPNVTLKIVLSRPDIKWVDFESYIYKSYYYNYNLAIEIIENKIDNADLIYFAKECIEYNLYKMPNKPMVIQIIKEHCSGFKYAKLPYDYFKNWHGIECLHASINPDIPIDVIRANISGDCRCYKCDRCITFYYYASTNPALTYETIAAEPDAPWNWLQFKYNKFEQHDYYSSWFSPWRRRMTHKMLDTIREELIAAACRPDRLMQWHEDAMNDMPDMYLEACRKY